MKFKALALLTIILSPCPVSAQVNKPVTININDIDYATVDRAGDIYVVAADGVHKYDPKGKSLGHLPISATTIFDTGNGVRMICYSGKSNEIKITDPTLQVISTITLDGSIAIEPILVCSADDYNALVFDKADASIKVIDTRQSVVTDEFKLDIPADASFSFMKKYQNFIFLSNNKSGIEVYNSFGKHLKSIEVKGDVMFNFLGEELYYYNNGSMHFIDLFTLEKREQSVPGATCKSVLMTDQCLVKIFASKIELTAISH